MNKSRLFNVYITTQAGELEVAKSRCACTKIPTEATHDLRRIGRDLKKLRIQSINISIEANRYRRNNFSTGNVLDILNDKWESQLLSSANIEQIMPLNYTHVNNKLITPSTVALFTVRTVGMPMLQKAFEAYFHKFKDTLPSAKFMPFHN